MCAGLVQTSAAFDRFTAVCPADASSSIVQFDQKLRDKCNENNSDEIWVAVYRSNNNLPSVIREEFFDAMSVATSAVSSDIDNSSITVGNSVEAKKPVAIGRIKKVESNQWLMDYLRCSLKKENTDKNCDGGSEHTEALGVCIDELVMQYLKREKQWKNGLRCKATIVSGKLLESRGFIMLSDFSADMATHKSWDIPLSMEMYGNRITGIGASDVVNQGSKINERSMKILSLLGKLKEDEQDDIEIESENEQDEDFDPWASVKKYI